MCLSTDNCMGIQLRSTLLGLRVNGIRVWVVKSSNVSVQKVVYTVGLHVQDQDIVQELQNTIYNPKAQVAGFQFQMIVFSRVSV